MLQNWCEQYPTTYVCYCRYTIFCRSTRISAVTLVVIFVYITGLEIAREPGTSVGGWRMMCQVYPEGHSATDKKKSKHVAWYVNAQPLLHRKFMRDPSALAALCLLGDGRYKWIKVLINTLGTCSYTWFQPTIHWLNSALHPTLRIFVCFYKFFLNPIAYVHEKHYVKYNATHLKRRAFTNNYDTTLTRRTREITHTDKSY
jgi:hypothetical protein